MNKIETLEQSEAATEAAHAFNVSYVNGASKAAGGESALSVSLGQARQYVFHIMRRGSFQAIRRLCKRINEEGGIQ